MVEAIARHENFSKGNTSVFRLKNGVTQVFLHGNHIANIYDSVEVNMDTFKAYPTNTTRSRLNALFNAFDSGKRARIKNGIPLIEVV